MEELHRKLEEKGYHEGTTRTSNGRTYLEFKAQHELDAASPQIARATGKEISEDHAFAQQAENTTLLKIIGEFAARKKLKVELLRPDLGPNFPGFPDQIEEGTLWVGLDGFGSNPRPPAQGPPKGWKKSYARPTHAPAQEPLERRYHRLIALAMHPEDYKRA